MPRFPVDAPKARVIRALEALGFRTDRERERVLMRREREDGTSETLTLPNHLRIKGHTLQNACRQAGLLRREFLKAYERAWILVGGLLPPKTGFARPTQVAAGG